MSFLGGAECSTSSNPLSQFTKHVQDDKSVLQDRLVGRRVDQAPQSMRSEGPAGVHDEFMNGFLQAPAPLASTFTGHAPAFEGMRQSFEQLGVSPAHTSSLKGPEKWATEYHPYLAGQPSLELSASAAAQHELRPDEVSALRPVNHMLEEQKPTWRTEAKIPLERQLLQPHVMMNSNLAMRPSFTRPAVNLAARHLYAQRPQIAGDIKGKGRMRELDDVNWEQQFAQIDAEGQRDLDAGAKIALEGELNDIDSALLDGEEMWTQVDYGAFDLWDGFDAMETGASFQDSDPRLGEYMFEEDNAFRSLKDPFTEGMRMMSKGKNLSLAALAFEAAVQKDAGHVEAWIMLGNAQAQNEKETPAIRALEQALKLDPSNSSALMGLAISYTNEGYESTAYRRLERWLAAKYPDIIHPMDVSLDADVGFSDRHQLHERVTKHFIRAAQLSPAGEHMDPDVQVGLGVLFYAAEEFEKAVDCFTAAISAIEAGAGDMNQRQQVHLLWNRLGATLANSGRSADAIAAYEKALMLRPNFVRARYNLGVSCINLGCYEEAAQHLLGAVAMHKQVERNGRLKAREVVGPDVSEGQLDRMITQNQSTNLFDTLRRVFSQMGRRELSDLVGPGMDLDTFRKEFDF